MCGSRIAWDKHQVPTLTSFSEEPYGGGADLRTVYCAFAISKMLDDWSGVRVDQALNFIQSCRVRRISAHQMQQLRLHRRPTREATVKHHLLKLQECVHGLKSQLSVLSSSVGGPTYCALASIFLADQGNHLTRRQKKQTLRWLVSNMAPSGGFRGRTCKEADACYSFWCGASLAVSPQCFYLGSERMRCLLDP